MTETAAGHDLADPDCWCEPELRLICPVCEPDPGDVEGIDTRQDAISALAEAADDDCWRCGGEGLCGEPEPWERQHGSVLVIHRYGDA